MLVSKSTKEEIEKAAEIILQGGLVSFPTETVYGLGANALDAVAVAKIFAAKKRPFFDPLIVHVSDMEMFERKTGHVPENVYKLTEKFWPGPLTVVLEKSNLVPDIVSAGLPTVAVRMPSHKVALDLIKCCNVPIAAPSANPFGYLSPTCAEHVQKQLGDSVDMILDGGQCQIGVESTIIKVDNDNTYLLRPGGVSLEDIEKVIGEVIIPASTKEVPDAPGQLKSHYAPKAKVKIIKESEEILAETDNSGLIVFRNNRRKQKFKNIEVLSEKGDLCEVAANLFTALHKMDNYNVDLIYVEEVPEVELGRAVMNRLKKASA